MQHHTRTFAEKIRTTDYQTPVKELHWHNPFYTALQHTYRHTRRESDTTTTRTQRGVKRDTAPSSSTQQTQKMLSAATPQRGTHSAPVPQGLSFRDPSSLLAHTQRTRRRLFWCSVHTFVGIYAHAQQKQHTRKHSCTLREQHTFIRRRPHSRSQHTPEQHIQHERKHTCTASAHICTHQPAHGTRTAAEHAVQHTCAECTAAEHTAEEAPCMAEEPQWERAQCTEQQRKCRHRRRRHTQAWEERKQTRTAPSADRSHPLAWAADTPAAAALPPDHTRRTHHDDHEPSLQPECGCSSVSLSAACCASAECSSECADARTHRC